MRGIIHKVISSIQDILMVSCVVMPFCLLSSSVLSQYYVGVNQNDFVDYCDPIQYTLDIEKLFNTTLNDIVLEVSFSEDVMYVSNSLGLTIKETTSRKIVFDYPDLFNCNLQRGEIIIQPKCYDVFTELHSSFTLKTPFVCLSESEERTIIKSPFVDLQFSDYSYDASSNQIRKSVRLFNAGSVDIDQFYILPIADQQFVIIESTSIGRLSGDTIIIDNAILKSKDSLFVDVVFALQNCELRSINYEVGFNCDVSDCVSVQRFIDENEVYQNNVRVEMEQRLSEQLNSIHYGLCETYSTPITVSNNKGKMHSSVADLYSLEFSILPQRNSNRRFEECMIVSARVNGVVIPVNKNFDSEYNLSFESLVNDPDGAGGLDDLDNDGQYDDLPLGESFDFDFELLLADGCYLDYQSLNLEFDTEIRFENFCNERIRRLNGADSNGYSAGNQVAHFFRGSFGTIDVIQKNANNKGFIQEGEIVTLQYNVRPSSNMTRICESNLLQLIIDIPPTVQWDESVEVTYSDETESFVLTPQMMNDSLMIINFEELASIKASIDIQFIGICDLNNTNYNAALDDCEQCIEYNLPRFRSQLLKECDINCAVPIPVWEAVSAPFFTKCESLPELVEPLVLEPIQYFNLTSGFIDQTETIKRIPFDNPSSINNRYYFDGDTMLVRIPFTFECAEELSAFSIQLIENQLSTYEFNIISSDVVLVNPADNSELNRCPANLFLTQSETAISLDFTESSFNLPCLDVGGTHVIDLNIVFTYDCELNSNCGLLRLGTLQGVTNVRLKNDCTRQVFYNQDTVYIHEVFKEEFFRPIGFSFGPQTVEIFDQFVITTPLYDGLFNKEDFESEFRRRPFLKSINYTIPEGFDVASDFLIVNDEIFFINGNIQLFDDSSKLDTLLQVVPQGVLNADGSMSYSFSEADIRYYSDQLGDPLSAGLIIQSVCNPAIDNQQMTVDGVVEYVDYANGTLDTIAYSFSQTRDLIFTPEVFIVEDDFQIIDSLSSASWHLNKTVDFFSFNNFISEDVLKKDEFIYYLKYQSKQMRIDSVTTANVIDQFPFDDIREQIPVLNSFIGDSIIEIEILPSFVIGADEDTFYNTQKPTQFVFHTSNHSCGFDTLFFELGRKAEFLKDTCSRSILSDLFVTYSPPGFPQLEWTTIPAEIKSFDENQLGFKLSNIGQGDLVKNKIVFDNFPSAEYSLFLVNKVGELENVSFAIDASDTLTIHLSSIQDGVLTGLAGLDLSSMEFLLVFNDVCVNAKLFTTTVKSISQSFCGDEIESPGLFSGLIPFVVEEDVKLELSLNSFTMDQCLDTAIMHIKLKSNTIQNLDNPELRLLLPKDIDSYVGTTTINGVKIPDPKSELSLDDQSTTFIITDGLAATLTDSVMVELKLDGSCIDLCRIDSVSAFFLTSLNQQCIDETIANQQITRAYSVNQTTRWKPNVSLQNVGTRIIDADQNELSFHLSGDISLTESPIHQGDVSVTIFGDLNQNTILDPTDVIVKQDLLSPEIFINQSYSLNDTLLLNPAIVCALHIIVDVDKSCSCLFSSQPLSQNGTYTSSRNIQNCNPDSILISTVEFDNCMTSLSSSHGTIISQVNGAVIVESDLLLPTDTIRFLSDCGDCQFIEEIIIFNEQADVEIALSSNSDCELTAQVLWNGGPQIPDDFRIQWNVDGELEATIQNLPIGVLSVELVNDAGCTYNDSIIISPSTSLNYEVILDELLCDDDFPAIVDVAAEGVDPLRIQWNDGESTFQRMDILPGRYQFTLTDGSGCRKTDTLDIQSPTDLTARVIVTEVKCDSLSSGSIEVIANDPHLQYALGTAGFTENNMFSNLMQGQYTVYIQNAAGCVDSIVEQIGLDTTFQIPIPLSRQATYGEAIGLNPELIDDDQYIWLWESSDFDLTCTTCADPQTIVSSEGQVALSVTNGVCTFNRLINISADYSDLIYVPNAFAPKASTQNSRFFVYPNASFDELDLHIFDRWGNELFAAQKLNLAEANAGWDGFVNGKIAEVGVYVYKAIARRFADELEIELLGDFLLVH